MVSAEVWLAERLWAVRAERVQGSLQWLRVHQAEEGGRP